MTGGRLVRLRDGYPELCPDVTRNLDRGARQLAQDPAVTAVFDRDPARIAAAWHEVTAARAARRLGAGRPVDLTAWRHDWAQATELATLRIGGQVAAWLIARPGPAGYRVLAGQMADQYRRRRPGTVLEALVVARALAGPQPWPPLPDLIEGVLKVVTVTLDGPGYVPHAVLDWGPGHPDTLLTRPARRLASPAGVMLRCPCASSEPTTAHRRPPEGTTYVMPVTAITLPLPWQPDVPFSPPEDLAPHVARQRLIFEFLRPPVVVPGRSWVTATGWAEPAHIEDYLGDMADTLGMRIVDRPRPTMASGYGYACWRHWDSSGVEWMDWQEPGGWLFVTVNVYTCKPFDPQVVAKLTERHFGPVTWRRFPVMEALEATAPPAELPPPARLAARAHRRLARAGQPVQAGPVTDPDGWRPRIEQERRTADWLAGRPCLLADPDGLAEFRAIWAYHAAAGRLGLRVATIGGDLAAWRVTTAGRVMDAGQVRAWEHCHPAVLLAAP